MTDQCQFNSLDACLPACPPIDAYAMQNGSVQCDGFGLWSLSIFIVCTSKLEWIIEQYASEQFSIRIDQSWSGFSVGQAHTRGVKCNGPLDWLNDSAHSIGSICTEHGDDDDLLTCLLFLTTSATILVPRWCCQRRRTWQKKINKSNTQTKSIGNSRECARLIDRKWTGFNQWNAFFFFFCLKLFWNKTHLLLWILWIHKDTFTFKTSKSSQKFFPFSAFGECSTL